MLDLYPAKRGQGSTRSPHGHLTGSLQELLAPTILCLLLFIEVFTYQKLRIYLFPRHRNPSPTELSSQERPNENFLNKLSLGCLRRLKPPVETKEHDELDQECWNINSTRGYVFFLTCIFKMQNVAWHMVVMHQIFLAT